MQPAVPFALLGVVQLLAVAGWLGLGGAGAYVLRGRGAVAAFLTGTVALAAADAATALLFGASGSLPLSFLRAAGFLLCAAGLAAGVRGRRVAGAGPARGGPGVPATGGARLPATGVLVPLGAAVTPTAVGAVAGGIAVTAAALVGRRRGVRAGFRVAAAAQPLMVASFLLATAAVAAGAWAQRSAVAAVTVLTLRAAAALAAIGVVAALARISMLARVAGAILAGVVVMALGSVGVVGQGVASGASAQEAAQLRQTATGEQAAVERTLTTQVSLVARVAAACVATASRSSCDNLLNTYAVFASYFAVVVQPGVGVQPLAGTLTPDAADQISANPVVAAVASGSTPDAGTVMLLPGSHPSVAVLGVAGGYRGARRAGRPDFVAVYGTMLDDAYLTAQSAVTATGLTVLADGSVLASSLPVSQRDGVLDAARQAGVLGNAPGLGAAVSDAGVGVDAVGDAPAVHFVPLAAANNDNLVVAVLAVSEPASVALAPQRSALSRLFLTALGVGVVVGAAGLWLGRRTTQPVLRLTEAARRVRAGDLSAGSGVSGRDEVGSLAVAFDGMTASLRAMTGELREVAANEAALRARLETVVGSMTDGLVVLDGDGRVLSLNPAAGALLGVDGPQAVGKTFSQIAVTSAAGELIAAGSQGGAADPGTPGQAEERDLVLARPGGAPVAVRMAVAPLLGADGVRHGTVLLLRDRTREREVERMKTEFLSNVSHELRTPLTPIRGFAEILQRRPGLSSEQVTQYAGTIAESSRRMARVVDLLVDVAAIEAGRVQPQPRLVEVSEFADDLLAGWRARWPDRAPDMRRRVAGGLPPVEVDPDWIGKALAELMDNAVKYTPPGSSITLVARLDRHADAGSRVELGVRDGGPGLAAERLPELLGDFAQGDGSATRRVGGLGLGLSFVRRLAEHLGLPLRASSEPGAGAEFVLSVPAAVVPAANGRRDGAARPRASRASAPVRRGRESPGSAGDAGSAESPGSAGTAGSPESPESAGAAGSPGAEASGTSGPEVAGVGRARGRRAGPG